MKWRGKVRDACANTCGPWGAKGAATDVACYVSCLSEIHKHPPCHRVASSAVSSEQSYFRSLLDSNGSVTTEAWTQL